VPRANDDLQTGQIAVDALTATFRQATLFIKRRSCVFLNINAYINYCYFCDNTSCIKVTIRLVKA
jgi:hypothetical protein